MTLQNSIFAPTPIAVAKGGTGNSAALTNGQLWIGNTGNPPSISNLTAGTNIGITNGAGTTSIRATGPASLTWTFNVTGAPTNFNMSAGFNGYTTTQSGIVFRTPINPSLGDIYTIQSYWLSVPGTGFSVARPVASTQSFQQNGVATGSLTTTNSNGSITIICIDISLGAAGAIFLVKENTGTFT